jgi:hypothetical protein
VINPSDKLDLVRQGSLPIDTPLYEVTVSEGQVWMAYDEVRPPYSFTIYSVAHLATDELVIITSWADLPDEEEA